MADEADWTNRVFVQPWSKVSTDILRAVLDDGLITDDTRSAVTAELSRREDVPVMADDLAVQAGAEALAKHVTRWGVRPTDLSGYEPMARAVIDAATVEVVCWECGGDGNVCLHGEHADCGHEDEHDECPNPYCNAGRVRVLKRDK